MHSKISAADDVNVDVSNFISLTEKTEIFGGGLFSRTRYSESYWTWCGVSLGKSDVMTHQIK